MAGHRRGAGVLGGLLLPRRTGLLLHRLLGLRGLLRLLPGVSALLPGALLLHRRLLRLRGLLPSGLRALAGRRGRPVGHGGCPLRVR
jgi:hypothetical protein